MKTVTKWLAINLSAVSIAAGVTVTTYGQTGLNVPFSQPSFGRVDACAGLGIPGTPSYGACQLQQRTLSQGADRAPNLRAINQTDRMRIEQACASDAPRGDAVYSTCLRRQLVLLGSDPTSPVRRIPATQRKPSLPVNAEALPNQ